MIVAAEMLTGRPGIGGFLWQEYNSAIYSHIILCILVIGIVGFILDRLMSLVERNIDSILGLPALIERKFRSSAGRRGAASATAAPAAEGTVAHALS